MDDAPSSPPADRPRSPIAFVRFLVTVAIGAWLLRSFLFAAFSIPTGSMMPTMLPGDYLFVSKWDYGYSRASFPWQWPSFDGRIAGRLPARGDIVVFKRPDAEAADWVKRVIGLPGDRVEVRDGVLVLNGQVVARHAIAPVTIAQSPNIPCRVPDGAVSEVIDVAGAPTCRYRAFRETLPDGPSYTVLDQLDSGPGDRFGPYRVPPAYVFLMGDNRDDSADSRFTLASGGIGPVPTDRIVGHARRIFWSTDGRAEFAKPWTWFRALRGERLGRGFE